MSTLVYRGLCTLLRRYDPPLRVVQVRARHPERRTVPDTSIGINHFIRVISALDDVDELEYPFHVVYSSLHPVPMQFNMRVQGVFIDGDLTPYGNWAYNGEIGPDPLQWMQLYWGYSAFKEQFEAQNAHLRAVVDACFSQVGLPAPQAETPPLLCLRRRIFRTLADAQVGYALRFDELRPDGTLLRCGPNDIYPGDVVEALVTVDIAVTRAEDTIPRTSVYLSFNRVTVIATEQDMWTLTGEKYERPDRDSRLDFYTAGNMGWSGPYAPAIDP
ncbi:uncharacterized protein STEHIDRAFT_156290 [Stereum hirsutum FP-91666 SS1]|uniref:uncharacterized protein n=1 Tax=Stereum hirsutum (strain FP-91666) TaxID=721885 RepID=UPI000440AA9E|nr:uncharacterized protein STEHIDRAFT_156290 [Stereum hirsutum FP-91666 SS1]EIM87309.1 hypothetical protein STEHIDRAFT_156290 [Stereum hirsutum FP-91666 SS1]